MVKTTEQRNPNTYSSDIGDILDFAANGVAHRPDGKWLSNHQINEIAKYQDEIRDGMVNRNGSGPEGSSTVDQNDPVALVQAIARLLDDPGTDPAKKTQAREAFLQILMGDSSEGGRSPLTQEELDIIAIVRSAREGGGSITFEEAREILAGRGKRPDNSTNTVGPTIDDEVQKNPDFWKDWKKSHGINEISNLPSDLQGEAFEQFMVDWKASKVESPDQSPDKLSEARNKYAEETVKDRKRFWGRLVKPDGFIARKLPFLARFANFVDSKLPGYKAMDKARGDYMSASKTDLAQKISEMRTSVQADVDRKKAELLTRAGEISGEEYAAALAQIEQEGNEDSMRAKEKILASGEDALLEAEIIEKQGELGAKASRFSNWWTRQPNFKDGFWKGLLGYSKKIAVLVGSGAAVGAAVTVGGLLLPIAAPIVGTAAAVAGGVTGGLMGLGVNKRKANSYVENIKKNPNAKTHGQVLSEKDLKDKEERRNKTIDEAYRVNNTHNVATNSNDKVDASDILTRATVTGTEQSTAETVQANRRRLLASIALAKAGALSSFQGVSMIKDALSSAPNTLADSAATVSEQAEQIAQQAKEQAAQQLEESAAQQAKFESWKDLILSGGGDAATSSPDAFANIMVNTNGAPEHALRAFADQLGVKLDGGQMDKLIHEGFKKFGDNLFVDPSSKPVDLTNFGGKIDIGYQAWDENLKIRFSPEAAKWFEAAIGK